MPDLIVSAANARVKRLRALKDKKHRRAEGLFLAEGLRIGIEALDAGWAPQAVAYAADREDHPLIRRLLRACRGDLLPCTPAVLSTLSGKDNPQAVVAAFPIPSRSLADLRPGARLLAAERLRDPGNLGTLLRTCDGAGASGMILMGDCTDPYSVEAVRASMGAIFTVPVVHASLADVLAWKARHGATLTGAALHPAARDYRAVAYGRPALLLLGNEAEGLPPALLEACDQLVRIPMRGRADSLNVAIAGALLLYETLREEAPAPPAPDTGGPPG
ncbi:TrmH family RNA methyltransferase [Thermaurantiacus tibetensis]|uniref:TrmH family RNA methyltransferase n=1 Tax=Thermaurantiacus tibetensis TaxID=2759035 RepID=UPI00188F8F87|nr:RNA methyltransferase [Thermaurantiacus tibetensis]